MPIPRKFDFLPVRNEDLRRKAVDEDDKPYVRIQKPGILIFPKKTLEALGLSEGSMTFMRFYIDVPKRALAFKFIDKEKAEEFKEIKTLSVKNYSGSVQGIISIKSILNQFGDWQMPARCEIGTYNSDDEYIHFGELKYIVIPANKNPDKENTSPNSGSYCDVPGCGQYCFSRRSLAQHKRHNHKE